MVHVPYSAYQTRGRVSPTYTLYHLSCLCTWGRLWCAPYDVLLGVMTEDIIYMSPLPIGNLKNHDPRGLGIIICFI